MTGNASEGAEYRRIASALAAAPAGRRVGIVGETGAARDLPPELELHRLDGDVLPFENGSVGALVLFDVLSRLPSSRAFFVEASRVLAYGGSIIVSEPYVGPLSYPVYKLLQREPVHLLDNPLNREGASDNQASATLLFGPRRAAFERTFPELRIAKVERLGTPSLPGLLGGIVGAAEDYLPQAAFRLVGFRQLVVLEKR